MRVRSENLRWLGRLAVVLGLLCGVSGDAYAKPPKPAFGDISLFASVPANPGFPEGVAVHGDKVFVSGPARFGTGGTGPSAIQVYNRKTGAHEQTIVVQGEFLEFEHAVSNIAMDGDGRIYALSTQLGLIRFVKQGQQYVQQAYGAPLPDLPTFLDAAPGQPSSPTVVDFPPICNDIVFDCHGNAYVTDSLQATIFRYPAGGGAPEIWFQDFSLQGGGFFPFGPNGVRLDVEREHLYMAQSTSLDNPALGRIVRLPLGAPPALADLEVVHEYAQYELPDQLAFDEDGFLYVTLALSNQISVLAPNGVEVTRINSKPSDAVPLENPAALAFDNRTKSLLVVNHALLTGNASHFAVLKVYVGEEGDELELP